MSDIPTKLVPLIFEQIRKETEAEWYPPRTVGTFRASEVGYCPRAIQYAILGHPRALPEPVLSLLFRDGHMHQNQLVNIISSTGLVVSNREQVGYKEYEVDGIKFGVTGHCDLLLEGKYVVDTKSCSTWAYKYLTRDYIKEKYLGYLYQLQFYIDMYEKDWGCLLFKDKNTSNLREFWYQKNPELLQEALQKLAKIHKAVITNKMIKRPYEKSSTECKRCNMRQHCWGTTED